MNKLAKEWVLKNCRFAQQDPVQQAEQKHIQTLDMLQVVSQKPDSDTERMDSDDPTAFEPGTVPGPLVEFTYNDVVLQGKVYWPQFLDQYMSLEDSIRVTIQDAPPKPLAGLINSGDKIEIKNLVIQPAEQDWFNVRVDVLISSQNELSQEREYDD